MRGPGARRGIACLGLASLALMLAGGSAAWADDGDARIVTAALSAAAVGVHPDIPPPLSPEAVSAEVADLRAALQREVPHLATPGIARLHALVPLAQAAMHSSGEPFQQPQLIALIDRNPQAQALWIVMVRGDGPWELIGGARVSTGQSGRFDHYVTPLGVFVNSPDNMGYRAEGTYNENGVRGLGVKGMRVWDFGWQVATKGWRADGETGPIRLEMHATDPDGLEQRIGRPASQGCVRIPGALNRFLDRHGIIDAEYEQAAVDDVRFRALLLPGRVPSRLAGRAIVVVDSSAAAQAGIP